MISVPFSFMGRCGRVRFIHFASLLAFSLVCFLATSASSHSHNIAHNILHSMIKRRRGSVIQTTEVPDFYHPTDELETLLKSHIDNCAAKATDAR